jgi:hypothetical protein
MGFREFPLAGAYTNRAKIDALELNTGNDKGDTLRAGAKSEPLA